MTNVWSLLGCSLDILALDREEVELVWLPGKRDVCSENKERPAVKIIPPAFLSFDPQPIAQPFGGDHHGNQEEGADPVHHHTTACS